MHHVHINLTELETDMAILAGKAIVVTGSGRGIGATIAKLAAAEGASVVVTDIDRDVAEQVAAEIVKAGGKAVAHAADITDWAGAGGLIQRCVDTYRKIDGLVNNAGLFRMGRVEEMNEADIRALMGANVIGTAFTARHAAPHMMKQKSGSIVNVTSGAHMGMPMMGAYGASKGAVASFTYTWSAELKDHGIRVNALSPMAATRMADSTSTYFAEKGMPAYSGTLPPPENNAPVVIFLLSDDAKSVTGQIVRIEGTQLSLVSHPGVAVPVLDRASGWNVAAITQAFRTDLGKRQLPVGVVGLKVEPTDIVSAFWKASK
jgi:NAD(P)-dependent dehydrogenase (short-subunit alcohol dehydrogenase family)